MIVRREGLLHHLPLASHVSIGRCLKIDGLAQLQRLLDLLRTEVEELAYLLGNLAVGHVDL